MKGACSLLAAGTLLCLLTNTALAFDFTTAGIEPQGSTPEEYAAELKKEDERVAQTVKAAGIKPQ